MSNVTDDYWVVVPSRGRVGNMQRIMALLPLAHICVCDNEADEYGKVVPKTKLWLHPEFERNAQKRQWIYDKGPAETVIVIDDDLRHVKCQVGRYVRTTSDPGAIMQILLNGRNLAKDMGVSLFSWGRSPHPMQFRGHDPFSLTGPCVGASGIVGRQIVVDTQLENRFDLDFTMRAIMRDRFVIHDKRFYFDFGPTGYGRGGLRSKVTIEGQRRSTEILKMRWGINLAIDKKLRSGAMNMSIRLPRRAAIATR